MASPAELVRNLPDLVRPLRRVEYDRLVQAGAFAHERVELLDGVLVVMSPQDPVHADAVQWLVRVLGQSIGKELDLRVQLPLAAGEASEPEPDIAIVPAGRYREGHPETAHLVIEVARSSQALDLGPKARLYAAAGVAEYWVVDLAAHAVIVHRGPSEAGFRTRSEQRDGVLGAESVPPVAVDLAELFG